MIFELQRAPSAAREIELCFTEVDLAVLVSAVRAVVAVVDEVDQRIVLLDVLLVLEQRLKEVTSDGA